MPFAKRSSPTLCYVPLYIWLASTRKQQNLHGTKLISQKKTVMAGYLFRVKIIQSQRLRHGQILICFRLTWNGERRRFSAFINDSGRYITAAHFRVAHNERYVMC